MKNYELCKIIKGIYLGKICHIVDKGKDTSIVDANGRKIEIKNSYLKSVKLNEQQLEQLKIHEQCLDYIVTHPYLKKLGFKKNDIGYNYALLWFAKNTLIEDYHDKVEQSNRLYLDEPNKPDGWKSVSELISCALSRYRFITNQ